MDLNPTAEDRAFRTEVRRWLETNVPTGDVKTLDERKAWHRKLYEAGYVGMLWPKEYGGWGRTPMQQAIVQDEMARLGAPPPINGLGIGFIGPTIIVHGTDWQKQRYLKKMLTAEEIWCQLYSEPNAGSDLASLKTRAEDQGDHFLVNGQKIWTSSGPIADWGILLARTDGKAAKHKGISCVLLHMRQPGVEVRPLRQITGSSLFSEVFMTNARAEKRDLIGNLNQGWEIAQTTLGWERGANSLGRVTRYAVAFNQLVRATKELRRGGKPLLEDAAVRARLGKAYAELEVQRYAAEQRLPGRRVVHHQALLHGVRETLLRARARDPRAVRPARLRARGVRGHRHLLRRARHVGDRVPLVARRHDLLGLLGDPEEHHRGARARPAQGSARGPPEGLTPWTSRSAPTSSS